MERDVATGTGKRLRVAAYCRVSTDDRIQLHSLEAQRRYFVDYIAAHSEWEMAGIWADEGVSGTTSQKRRQFMALMATAESGAIDLILTKEVSRFARNTVDTLRYTRWLKSHGVGVLFLQDNIDTRGDEGELRLAIMASVAQEESRKSSERIKWGQRRAMERGIVFGARAPYGYQMQNGALMIEREQAIVVQRIYHMFLEEKQGLQYIARALNADGIASPQDSSNGWSAAMVSKLLKNEKYCGDLRQRKSYTPDFLTHQSVWNTGQEKQICLRAHHVPIISRETFEHVQHELARRKASYRRKSTRYWCSGKVWCGACGAVLTPRRSFRKDGSVYLRWKCGTCSSGAVSDMVLRACAAAAVLHAEGEISEEWEQYKDDKNAIYEQDLQVIIADKDAVWIQLRGGHQMYLVAYKVYGRGKDMRVYTRCR